jgi:hypothetical protein
MALRLALAFSQDFIAQTEKLASPEGSALVYRI